MKNATEQGRVSEYHLTQKPEHPPCAGSRDSLSFVATCRPAPTSRQFSLSCITMGNKQSGDKGAKGSKSAPQDDQPGAPDTLASPRGVKTATRSEEHTSELQSPMSISYAVFRL